jgi:hypothetical protein
MEINLLTILSVPVLPVLYIPFLWIRGWPAVGEGNLLPAILAVFVTSGIFIAFCVGCWLFISFIFPPKCPNCGTNQKRGRIPEQICTECGGEMFSWLFVQDPLRR